MENCLRMNLNLPFKGSFRGNAMYLTGIFISNIRSIKSLVWKIEAHEAPGWHVVIGDNGSGKSSILRSIAMALIGESGAEALQQNWNTYLRYETKNGNIKIDLLRNNTYDQFIREGVNPAQSLWRASIELTQEENHEVHLKNLPVICTTKVFSRSPDGFPHRMGHSVALQAEIEKKSV